MWLAAGIVTVFVVAELPSLFVPLQPATRQPVAGVAVRVMFSPATNCPVPHSVDLLGVATGLLPWPVWVRDRV